MLLVYSSRQSPHKQTYIDSQQELEDLLWVQLL